MRYDDRTVRGTAPGGMRGVDPIEAHAMRCYGAIMTTKAKPPGKALGSVIALAASVTVIYILSILFTLPFGWISGLLLSSMGVTVWMVIRILKDPYSTDQTFDDCFYQDRPDIRHNAKK